MWNEIISKIIPHTSIIIGGTFMAISSCIVWNHMEYYLKETSSVISQYQNNQCQNIYKFITYDHDANNNAIIRRNQLIYTGITGIIGFIAGYYIKYTIMCIGVVSFIVIIYENEDDKYTKHYINI